MAKLSSVIEAEIDAAMQKARDFRDREIAVSVRYVPSTDLLLIVLRTGRRIAIPREDLQGLAGEKKAAVADVEIVGSGSALHWPQLDIDFSVVGLAEGHYGNERWMRNLGAKGLSAKRSVNKALAKMSNFERLVAAGVVRERVGKRSAEVLNSLSKNEVDTLIKIRSNLKFHGNRDKDSILKVVSL